MDKKIHERITENMSYLRKINAYSREEVANHLHVSRMSYTRYETGEEMISANLLVALAELYHLRTSVLLEPDKKEFIKQVTLQRMGGEQMNELASAFFRLSPFAQGCLVERASMLLSLEQEGKEEEPKK
mgnify:CR=1 FL=1